MSIEIIIATWFLRIAFVFTIITLAVLIYNFFNTLFRNTTPNKPLDSVGKKPPQIS